MTPTLELPTAVRTAAQIRAVDAYAIEQLGIPGHTLMSRAGAAAFRVLKARWPKAERIVVVCGSGNNAGDGYVVARLARHAGLSVTAIALFDPTALRGDARTAWLDYTNAGGQVVEWRDSLIAGADVLVDAMFGTGLSRPLADTLKACVEAMNASGVPILALDIPSGLQADSGNVLGAAIRATCTISFVGLKLGFYLGVAPDYLGHLEFASLQIPETGQIGSVARRIDDAWLAKTLQRRSRLAHKGLNGHVLVIGGNHGMPGAVRLAGEAALRVGAGLVTVATRSENTRIVGDRPELMARGVESAATLAPLIERADIIAVGPGLGLDAWSEEMFRCALTSGKPLVVDADALNLLAKFPQKRPQWVLTPHPGEAGRMLESNAGAVQRDRLASLNALVARYGGIVVLKGARTLVGCADELPAICDCGNPGMSTAGMGDVLTGAIAGIAAQIGDLWAAARAGVRVHAQAGDAAAVHGERGIISSDLFEHLHRGVNPT